MPTPGIADPYWFEWYVGIENIIKMLNPDSDIDYVTFQCAAYNTIDDIVVSYKNGAQKICFQVKHEISTTNSSNLSFGKLIERDTDSKKCLISAMALGWQEAITSEKKHIVPVLYTNRKIGTNRYKRSFNDKAYSSYPIEVFFPLLKETLGRSPDIDHLAFEDENLEMQWNEMCNAIEVSDKKVVVEFVKAFVIEGNQPGLESLEKKFIESIAEVFACSETLAIELFGKLIAALRIWTTTRRIVEKVTLEDVYSSLGTEVDINSSQHRLAPPFPFFESRKVFCKQLVQLIKATDKKVVFISGDPGSGKTSVVSYLQAESALFLIRYHTFKPISPEQHFYDYDEGMCTPENLWGTLLIQLRHHFRGRLAQCKVPLNNHFCTTEEMRGQVNRLLCILGKEAISENRKIFVCIDGIDHAARVRSNLSFLNSLFLPNELPDGVCFVIVGQPAEMYQTQYPIWLSNRDDIEPVDMPRLCIDDIKQLIVDRAPHFDGDIEGLAKLVFQHTQGNNLSTVFAVEELRNIAFYEEAITHMQHSCVSADIHQYYQHIWNFVKRELAQIGLDIPYPESIVACPILLMNGRVNTRILASALPYRLSEAVWRQIFCRLYPLVVPSENISEYSLFHNDFRIFLMGIINGYQAIYKEIAIQLAEYLHDNDEGVTKYVMSIPLLCCAERRDLIPKYFTTDFVIEALAEGVSKLRLDEYARLSYDAACGAQDEGLYCDTYLAIKTLYQHGQYYEYYNRSYRSADAPELVNIDIAEIRNLPISKDNIDEYSRVLLLCDQLKTADDAAYTSRALYLYSIWFDNYSPVDFLSIDESDDSEEDAWRIGSSEVKQLLQLWGKTAAKLDREIPLLQETISDKESKAILCFGDAYFDASFELKEYDRALRALDAGCVSRECFEKSLEEILYNNLAITFSGYIQKIAESASKFSIKLLAQTILTFGKFEIKFSTDDISETEPIKHLYEESSFTVILFAFLVGCYESNLDEIIVCGHAKIILNALEGEEKGIEQISKLTRLACLLGKYHMQSTGVPSEALKRHMNWFLTTKLWRRFDYSKAYRFLLSIILNDTWSDAFIQSELISNLEVSLFDIDALGMYYKTDILDFLKEHEGYLIVKKYIQSLYGEDGSDIFQNENYADLHARFRPYGDEVLPDVMHIVTDKLKWDVVAYTGHKEYSMQGPAESFEELARLNPTIWSDLGIRLYRQSQFAEISSNTYAFDIQKCIVKAAIQSGLKAFWQTHFWDEDIKMNPELLYNSLFEFIGIAKTEEDLVAVWLINCGIHSWYTQEGRMGSTSIYEACTRRAKELGVDLQSLIAKLTPDWMAIIQHNLLKSDNRSQPDEYTRKWAEEKEAIQVAYESISAEALLEDLSQVMTYSNAWDRFNLILSRLETEHLLDYKNSKKLLSCVCMYLQGKSWPYEGYDGLINKLLNLLHEEAFWAFANTINGNLSDYNYQTSVRNMQLLLKLSCSLNASKLKDLFVKELRTQEMWITGHDHIFINNEIPSVICSIPIPSSFVEMAVYLLLEQIETQNGRKTESAILGIYKLGVIFSSAIQTISLLWGSLSEFQKDIILIVIARWSVDRVNGFNEIYEWLYKEYFNCNSLARKYYLHSILRLYSSDDPRIEKFNCTADPIDYYLPTKGICGDNGLSDRFLNMSEQWYDSPHMNDDIRRYIKQHNLKRNHVDDRFSGRGDCTLPDSSIDISQILYGEEKIERWSDIPILIKKCWLLQADDPFILTDMPKIVFDEEWFHDFESVAKNSGKSNTIKKLLLSQIAHKNCCSFEKVVGACIWYPWGHDEGALFYEVTKIVVEEISLDYCEDLHWCIGNYGLLFQEGHIDEQEGESLHGRGISLFKKIGGNMSFYHGNCQIAPAHIWRDIFQCTPETRSPYSWIDSTGKEVLRFERITSPTREAMYEKYYRQPVLFRWICDSDWLQRTLVGRGLRLRYVSEIDKLPE